MVSAVEQVDTVLPRASWVLEAQHDKGHIYHVRSLENLSKVGDSPLLVWTFAGLASQRETTDGMEPLRRPPGWAHRWEKLVLFNQVFLQTTAVIAALTPSSLSPQCVVSILPPRWFFNGPSPTTHIEQLWWILQEQVADKGGRLCWKPTNALRLVQGKMKYVTKFKAKSKETEEGMSSEINWMMALSEIDETCKEKAQCMRQVP